LVHTKLPEAVQLSVAVGSVQDTVAVQTPAPLVRKIFDGHPLISGFCVSFTVTVKLHCLVRDAPSVTVTVTVVTPTLKVLVPICPVPPNTVAPVVLHEMVTLVQLSAAVMAGTATLAEQRLLSLLTTMFSGQLTVGSSTSVTVTVRLHVAVLLEASVTV
jgi:hypothetical protein